MRVSDLKDGQQVKARFSRRDNEDGTAPEWSKWKDVTLYVQRLTQNQPKRYGGKKQGEIAIIGIRDFSWAEYRPEDFCSGPYHEFLVEEYRMQIEGVTEF